MTATATIRGLLAQAAKGLPGAEARLEAELLLVHVLDRPRAWLYAHADDPVDAATCAAYERLLQRRCAGEPIAYLTGHREFWSMRLTVSAATLIPRADTELLVECALDLIPAAAWRVADLGTGTGAVALALARERPACRIIATDASVEALKVAQNNAASLGIANVDFVLGDWCEALSGPPFDLIASNPPYIASDDPHLHQGDLRYEPQAALASGVDGLNAIRTISAQARSKLRAGGWLLLEHGNTQSAAVQRVLSQDGYRQIDTRQDLELRDRVSLAQWAG